MKNFTTILTLLLTLLLTFAATLSAQNYPFTITQPGEEPVLYYIYSGRDGNGGKGNYVFSNKKPWGKEEAELCLNYLDEREEFIREQCWYFMEAEDGNIMIISAHDHKMITVANTGNAPKCTKILSKEDAAGTYHTWIFNETNGCYAFQTSDRNNFLSHNGNWSTGGQQMGLWNANGANDEGSRVFFEKAPANITAGIEEITIESNNTVKGIYTLTGHKIEKITTSGIYIIDGKKTIVKF